MERLTKRHGKGIASNERKVMPCSNYCDSCGNADCDTVRKMIRKLADYEDLEEQGLLIRFPCKVGDTVYVPEKSLDIISEYVVDEITICKNPFKSGGDFIICFGWDFISGSDSYMSGFEYSDIGKTVFLTYEDAEQKLKEWQKEGEDNEQIS